MLALAAFLLTANSHQAHPTWVDVPCSGWRIFVDEARESVFVTSRDSIKMLNAAGRVVRTNSTNVDGDRYLGISQNGEFIVEPEYSPGTSQDARSFRPFEPYSFGTVGPYLYYQTRGALIVHKNGIFRGAIPIEGGQCVIALEPKTGTVYARQLYRPLAVQRLSFSGRGGRAIEGHWSDGSAVSGARMDTSVAVLGSHFYFVAYATGVKIPGLEHAINVIDRLESTRWPSPFTDANWDQYVLTEMDLRSGLCRPIALSGEWVSGLREVWSPIIGHLAPMAGARRLAWLHQDHLLILSLDGTPLEPPPPIEVLIKFSNRFRGRFTLQPDPEAWHLSSQDGVLQVPIDGDGTVKVDPDDFALLASRSRKDEFVLGSGKKVHALNGPNDTPAPGLNAYLAKPSGPQPQFLEGYLIEK